MKKIQNCKFNGIALTRWVSVAALAFFLSACGMLATPTPTPTITPSPSATWTMTPLPTATPTHTATALPTSTQTSTPKPSATATRPRTPTQTATPKPTAGPSPTSSPAQACANLIAKKQTGIFVMSIQPVPELVWDKTPRQFNVGVCNALPPPSVPQGKYKVVLNFPGSNHGLTQSAEVRAELKAGLNQVSIGPWIPGLENHLASCAVRAVAETQVMYNDTPDPFFRALFWFDGKDRVPLAIQCGGNYP